MTLCNLFPVRLHNYSMIEKLSNSALAFINWLSTSYGSGDLLSDLCIALLSALACSLLVLILARIGRGVNFTKLSNNDIDQMANSLDMLQVELLSISRALRLEFINRRIELQNLRHITLSATQDSTLRVTVRVAAR